MRDGKIILESGRCDRWWRSTPKPARGLERQERRSEEGRDDDQRPDGGQGQGHRRHQRRRVRRAGTRHRLQLKDGSKAWRAYSVGPDDQILFDANTTELGKPVGKDSSLEDLARRPVEDRRRRHLGLVLLRSAAELDLLRLGQSEHLEPGAAAGRQQMVDDHFRPQSRYRRRQMGLSDDAARRMGLRRRQRDDPGRHQREGPADQGARALRPQRLRLHPQPRDRRVAGRREVRSKGQLGHSRRHGRRAGPRS